MAKCWAIMCENFEGENSTFYFKNYKIANENFDILCEKNKNQKEFKKLNECTVSWFDPRYNEYSTYINLIKIKLPTIYNEIIF